MATKVKDLAVKTGTYTSNGEEKGRWRNVGSLMKNDEGGYFILMDRTFNPAGVPGDSDRDNILISVFDLRDDQGQRQSSAPAKREAPPAKAASTAGVADDDIPF